MATQDRQARIELGAGYDHSRDKDAERIMARKIVPYFRQSRYAEGVTSGVKALIKEFGGLTPTRDCFPGPSEASLSLRSWLRSACFEMASAAGDGWWRAPLSFWSWRWSGLAAVPSGCWPTVIVRRVDWVDSGGFSGGGGANREMVRSGK